MAFYRLVKHGTKEPYEGGASGIYHGTADIAEIISDSAAERRGVANVPRRIGNHTYEGFPKPGWIWSPGPVPSGRGRSKFIQRAIKHPGALHRELHVPAGEKIPVSKLRSAAKKPGKLGQRARFALELRGFGHHSHPSHPYSHPRGTKHRRK